MEKDAHRYHSTEGWNWGRWRGLDLKPYGKDAHFVNECTGCHLPVRGNDYVYTLPMTGRRKGSGGGQQRSCATRKLALSTARLECHHMYVDRGDHTMTTLYGNDAAIRRQGEA